MGVYDWLADLRGEDRIDEKGKGSDGEMVEVQFKNTRKGYYVNSSNLDLKEGNLVAVGTISGGHDIGTVTLIGRLALLQMKKNKIDPASLDIRKIYRIATAIDIERYEIAKAREHETMIVARRMAVDLMLDMKIGDVEFRGDGNKAVFYYIAEGRVDFRQLIRLFAESFGVRIEMRQIGVRQEAGRIGGLGPCGRELCCSGWMNSFETVNTNAARCQDISMNPQKLAGQCTKLKCCFNHEVDVYIEAQDHLPPRDVRLETQTEVYYHFKTDIFKGEITYSTERSAAVNLVTIPANRVFEVIGMNEKGEKPLTLTSNESIPSPQRDAQDILGENSLTRFDHLRKKKKNRSKNSSQQPQPQPRRQVPHTANSRSDVSTSPE
jgi:cell fate regulator YaaT (PSP1 superfamily)